MDYFKNIEFEEEDTFEHPTHLYRKDLDEKLYYFLEQDETA